MLDELLLRSRILAAVLEPIVASVYFSPEAHAAFADLGFGPSTGPVSGDPWLEHHWGTADMPDYTAYFYSRGSLLGAVPGEVVAACFGIFQPAAVIAAVNTGRSIAGRDETLAARDQGAIAQLERILGPEPDRIHWVNDVLTRATVGLDLADRPMYAGVSALPTPVEPVGAMWRLGERLREFRGDAFRAAYSAAGFTGCEIQMLTEMLAGFPRRAYTSGRVWTEEQMDEAERRLAERGFVADGQATPAGAEAREAIELTTDRLCQSMITQIGDDFEELVSTLSSWGVDVIAGRGHAPATPQEQVMDESIQEWMERHGLPRFAFGPR